jgi:hypothetical protein
MSSGPDLEVPVHGRLMVKDCSYELMSFPATAASTRLWCLSPNSDSGVLVPSLLPGSLPDTGRLLPARDEGGLDHTCAIPLILLATSGAWYGNDGGFG